MQIFRVRVVLRATDAVRLHAHHAAILYSLIAQAYGTARGSEPCVPDGLLLDAPEQARLWVAPGSTYAFGFTLLAESPSEAARLAELVVVGLRKVGRRRAPNRPALGGNFEVELVQDLVAGATLRPSRPLAPIPSEFVDAEINRLRDRTSLTLQFVSPLRAHRPKKARSDGHQYFDRFYFSCGPLIQRMAARLNALGLGLSVPIAESATPVVASNRLVWLDLSYGPRQTRKALGGAVGCLMLTEVRPEVVACLVWGQYVRIGEATRFGFGYYRIEELGPPPFMCRRSTDLLTIAVEQSSLDEAAARWELPAGEARAAARQLLGGEYYPRRHFRVEIPKPDGGCRTLSVPSRLDRVLQRAVLDCVAPALDLFLEESSLAYRRGLGRHTAAKRLQQAYADGFRWALKADFLTFFDSVDHATLRERVAAYTSDESLTEALMKWVVAGAPAENRGVPTGAPLSPLLANLFLDEFDETIERLGRRLIRYADDFVILFRTEEEAAEVLRETRRAAEALQLELNRDKTRTLELGSGFDFLGYRFEPREAWEFQGPEGPQRIEELGWKERSRRAVEVDLPRLPGESDSTSPLPGVLIAGPDLEEVLVHGENLQFKYRDRRGPESVPILGLTDLTVIGPVGLPRPVLELLHRRAIPLSLVDESGRLITAVEPFVDEPDAIGPMAQLDVARHPEACLAVGRQLIAAKLHNYATLAAAYRRPTYAYDCERLLERLSQAALHAGSIDELLGIEGSGAAAWYGSLGPRLPSGFTWIQRIAPSADDPVNILLNLAFTVLHRFIRHSIRHAKLLDTVGLLHRPRAGHAALASDLQEPFRHLMDRAVLETVRRIRPEDFEPDERGPYPVRMKPRALRESLAWIHRLLARSCQGENQHAPLPYRLQIVRQARSLRRFLTQPESPFLPFRHP